MVGSASIANATAVVTAAIARANHTTTFAADVSEAFMAAQVVGNQTTSGAKALASAVLALLQALVDGAPADVVTAATTATATRAIDLVAQLQRSEAAQYATLSVLGR